MAGKKIDTQTVGLDTGLALARWLTGKEHLHYGLWTGIDVSAGNVGQAQEAYSVKLLALLPPRAGLRILDIGGGAGETAKRLITMGHTVEIVVPSAFLADRCRVNAPQAVVHECRFEDLHSGGGFDVCLFSESFQYIPPTVSLPKARGLLAAGGEIVIGDCFRSDEFRADPERAVVGGGHALAEFRKVLASQPLRTVSEEDITEAVAPSIDLEQAFFNVFGVGFSSFDRELQARRPWRHWAMHQIFKVVISKRRRTRLGQRLFETARTSASFCVNNRYLLIRLAQADQPN